PHKGGGRRKTLPHKGGGSKISWLVTGQMAADERFSFEQHYIRATRLRRFRRRQSRRSCTDHANVCLEVFDCCMDCRGPFHIDATQPRNVPNGVLENRPQPAWSVEALVIKADRQKSIELIEGAQHIEIQRWPRILMRHHHPLPRRLDAGADIRPAVYV